MKNVSKQFRAGASVTSEPGAGARKCSSPESPVPLSGAAAGPWHEEKVTLETRDLIGSIFLKFPRRPYRNNL